MFRYNESAALVSSIRFDKQSVDAMASLTFKEKMAKQSQIQQCTNTTGSKNLCLNENPCVFTVVPCVSLYTFPVCTVYT